MCLCSLNKAFEIFIWGGGGGGWGMSAGSENDTLLPLTITTANFGTIRLGVKKLSSGKKKYFVARNMA